MDTAPTSDEKIMAALAHGSVFLMFLGPVLPVIIWAFQRKKSKYVCFHALQAMGYQALLLWLWILMPILIIALTVCLAIPAVILASEDANRLAFASVGIQVFIFLSIFGFMGLFFLTGIIGAVSCLLGRDFRYPLIGKWLGRYLPYQADLELPIDETREDNWVAGVCHATAVLQMWGIVTPLIVWFTQKERSARLRFQSMQAFIYQGIALAVYIGGMALYMAAVFGMMLTAFTAGTANRGGEIQGPAGELLLILLGIVMILWLAILLLTPLYCLLAALAAFRAIQGRPFHYPIIAGMLARRMQTSQKLESNS